jgi:hypothetical protein
MTAARPNIFQTIRETLQIDRKAVEALATERATREVEACAGMGWPRRFPDVFDWALTLTLMEAKAALDGEIARRAYAALPASEQWARSAELEAEIADGSIPPRHAEARQLRDGAARLRRASLTLISAE